MVHTAVNGTNSASKHHREPFSVTLTSSCEHHPLLDSVSQEEGVFSLYFSSTRSQNPTAAAVSAVHRLHLQHGKPSVSTKDGRCANLLSFSSPSQSPVVRLSLAGEVWVHRAAFQDNTLNRRFYFLLLLLSAF
ncbi:hypothetical protein GN956_G2390 [Arapaima gigas]